jgi:hypothetical protein
MAGIPELIAFHATEKGHGVAARHEIRRISSARYAARFSSQAASAVPRYCTLPAEFSRTTLESTAVSDLSGKCEQKPTPT